MEPISSQAAPKPRRRWPWHLIAPGIVALAVGGVLVASSWRALRPAIDVQVAPAVFVNDGPAVINVQAQSDDAPARPTGGVTVQAPGWLEADPYYTACSALADGVVQAIDVLEGEPVDAGQVVARLVPDDAALALRRAEADVDAAQAEVRIAEADLTAARDSFEQLIDRKRTAATTKAIVAETEALLAQLPALIAADEATLAGQREELTRAEAALQSGAATDIEVIIMRKRVDALAAALDALRAREAILQARLDRQRAEVQAADRHVDLRIEERRDVAAAEANLARAKAALMQQEAQRDEAALRFERMVIRAPMTGLVQRRLKSPGDKVMLGMDDPHSAHIVHVYDPKKLQVRVDVPLADAAHVFVGQHCEVIVEVLPETTFAGEVTRITNEADLQKNTLQVKVRVHEPSAHLRPEMLTRVKFLPGAPGSVSQAPSSDATEPATQQPIGRRVQIPASGLVDSAGTPRVWIVRDRRGTRGIARSVDVQVASTADGWARVTGALHAGDLVIVSPPELAAGAPVRIRTWEGETS